MPIAPTKILEIEEGDDPKAVVLSALEGTFDTWRVLKNEVIVATAPAASKTRGGIFMPDKTKAETRFQGTVGLIMALGETAFDDASRWPNEDTRPKVGDWVHYRASSTEEFAVSDISCRYVLDTSIHSVVPGPEGIR